MEGCRLPTFTLNQQNFEVCDFRQPGAKTIAVIGSDRTGGQIQLCLLAHKAGTSNVAYVAVNVSCTHDIKLLKSNLQKCIRQCDAEAAIATALVMIDRGETAILLRRLTIIVLEDVDYRCSLEFNGLMWYYLATSAKYRLTELDVDFILYAIKRICDSSRPYRSFVIGLEPPKHLATATYDEVAHFKTVAAKMVWFRRCFNGMPGEIDLLTSTALQLDEEVDRPAESLTPLDIRKFHAKETTVPRYAFSNSCHLRAASVDFHCYPGMIKVIRRGAPELRPKAIRAAIWYHSSVLNRRLGHAATISEETKETQPAWDKIKLLVKSYAIAKLQSSKAQRKLDKWTTVATTATAATKKRPLNVKSKGEKKSSSSTLLRMVVAPVKKKPLAAATQSRLDTHLVYMGVQDDSHVSLSEQLKRRRKRRMEHEWTAPGTVKPAKKRRRLSSGTLT